MDNQGNMTLPKEQNKVPVIGPKEMEIYKLLDKEFKIIVLQKLSELQQRDNMKSGKQQTKKMRNSTKKQTP